MLETSWWLFESGAWLRIHKAPLRSARSWFHICVKVSRDNQVSAVNVSVNGGNITSMERELEVRDLTKIIINLGLAHPSQRERFDSQFTGLITNINIYKATSQLDIQKMSSDPCQFASSGQCSPLSLVKSFIVLERKEQKPNGSLLAPRWFFIA